MKVEGRCPECRQESQRASEPVVRQHGNGKILCLVELACTECGATNKYVTGMTRT